MSFSSASWTIPELCVWIATRDKAALNSLAPVARRSLKFANMVHPGAYTARDEVIEAAQQGKIIITCAGEADRYQSNPNRMKLSLNFWNNAELTDASHWQAPGSYWCVARRIDQPNTAKEYRDLLVDSAKAKALWPQPLRSSEAGISRATPEVVHPEKPRATDTQMLQWMQRHQHDLKAAGELHGREIILSAAREHFGVLHKVVRDIWDRRAPDVIAPDPSLPPYRKSQ